MPANRIAERDAGVPATRGMAWLFGEMFLVPIRTFIFGMERLLETMKGLQQVGDRGMELMTGGPPAAEIKPQDTPSSPEISDVTQGAASGGTESEIEETKMDKDLNDDMLKLVRYKILFVKRDYEHAFPEKEELVSDNIDGTAFTAWKIAEFIQTLHREVSVSGKWKDYGTPHVTYHAEKDICTLRSLDEDDKKYLRVYYEVLERYHREKFKYEEDHIDELKKQTRYLGEIARAKTGS
jgi:hypothetical protein